MVYILTINDVPSGDQVPGNGENPTGCKGRLRATVGVSSCRCG